MLIVYGTEFAWPASKDLVAIDRCESITYEVVDRIIE